MLKHFTVDDFDFITKEVSEVSHLPCTRKAKGV